MARNRRKMSLYEVIRDAKVTPRESKPPEQPVKSDKDKRSTMPSAAWPRKPRIVQLNAGRVEFSLPYQIVIVLALGLLLLIFLVYRLGQISGKTTDLASITAKSRPQAVEQRRTAGAAEQITPVLSSSAEEAEPVQPKGNNNIVITEYPRRIDLVPVQKYFAQNGIATEIVKVDESYFLRTVEKYENPGRLGTDGYEAKQRIIELGAEYKAPTGYETFGTKPFQDAYGRRFDD
jgi:hypothetical protein